MTAVADGGGRGGGRGGHSANCGETSGAWAGGEPQCTRRGGILAWSFLAESADVDRSVRPGCRPAWSAWRRGEVHPLRFGGRWCSVQAC